MPRRKARYRDNAKSYFDFDGATHAQRVRYLRRLIRDWSGLSMYVDQYEADPETYAHVPGELEYTISPESMAQARAELEKMWPAQDARTDKTPLPPHGAHAPVNSQTQDGLTQAPEPSSGNFDEEHLLPRALYL